MPTVLITGSSRGLGLEFCSQYASSGWEVFATCRNPEESLLLNELSQKNENISVLKMDVANHSSIDSCSALLKDEKIDILINNAGIASNHFDTQKLGGFDFANWENIIRINTLGPMKVCESFLGQILAGEQKKIAVVSSRVGSLSDMNAYPVYPYATSKAALNKGMRLMSEQLRDKGISIICLCPGHAKTDMGLMAPGASVEVSDAVSGMRKMIFDLTQNDTSSFKQYDGDIVPW